MVLLWFWVVRVKKRKKQEQQVGFKGGRFFLSSLFYNLKCYPQPFGRGGAVKLWEEKAHSLNEL